MALVAALDIGTNSFHLVVARPAAGGGFETVTSEKEIVRLGHGGGDMKVLSDDAIERGIGALGRMRRIAESVGAPLRAVATSAVREAENAAVFLRRARAVGVDVEVISGTEEARLIHLGVLQAVPVFDRRALLCDIGGGSTEVLVGERGEVLTSRSFKLGAVRLTDRFFPGGAASKSAVEECRAFVRSTLAVYEREVRAADAEVAVGSSGTIEQLTRLAHLGRGGAPLRTYNCAEITADDLAGAVTMLTRARTTEARRRIAGLEPERADIVVAGALILEGVFETFGVDRMMFSENALREGVLLDTIQRSDGGTVLHHLRDVSRRSVRHLADLCDDDVEHSAHVAALALQIFDGTAALHGLDALAREYLEAGALLSNVGLFISHSRHHLHSYYVIRNAEHLAGLTDHEIEIIALVARYHRKSAPKPSHEDFARLDPGDQQLVRTLAGILRVAMGLDRSHDRRVGEVAVRVGDRAITIDAIAPDTVDVALEIYAANSRRGLLEEVLAADVEVVPASGS